MLNAIEEGNLDAGKHEETDQSKSSISITAKTYSGCYGGETTNIADGIVVEVSCRSQPLSLSLKQIIFVVDESGSMVGTMPSVKASLFAARNSLIKLLGYECSTENERDSLFTEECNSSIITFSDTSKCEWESVAAYKAQNLDIFPIPFSVAVNKLEAESSTNLGDALQTAFSKKLPDHATWIILLTDGVPNKGNYQTVEAFGHLMNDIPVNTKIIPLGYTTSFDPEILSILGLMTYLDSEEAIAETLGSIMGEIVTSYGMNAKIMLPNLVSEQINPNEVIVVPDTINVPREIIGSRNVGCLYNERKYVYGYLPWGNTIQQSLSRYTGLEGQLSYYDIAKCQMMTHIFNIDHIGSLYTDDICEAYFESSKARTILGIYQTKKKGQFDRKYVDSIKAKLEDWKHPRALSHKQEILRLLSNSSAHLSDYVAAVGIASSAQNQVSYTSGGRYSTTTQRIASSAASEDYRSLYSHPVIAASNPYVPVTIDTALINNIH